MDALEGPCDTDGTSQLLSLEVPAPESIYKTPEGETEIRALYEEELAGFGGPVAVFASEEDALFPARAVLPRARGIFHDLALAQTLEGCRHVPSMAVLRRVNERILAFLAGPDGA